MIGFQQTNEGFLLFLKDSFLVFAFVEQPVSNKYCKY